MPISRDILDRWTKRRDELRKLHATVDGAVICDEILADLDALQRADDADLLTLAQAATASGYCADHLGRLIKAGTLTNYGRRHAPRVRRSDLPRKPGYLPSNAAGTTIEDPRRVALSAIRSIKIHGTDAEG